MNIILIVLPEKAPNSVYMNDYHKSTLRKPTMQSQKLLMLS